MLSFLDIVCCQTAPLIKISNWVFQRLRLSSVVIIIIVAIITTNSFFCFCFFLLVYCGRQLDVTEISGYQWLSFMNYNALDNKMEQLLLQLS